MDLAQDFAKFPNPWKKAHEPGATCDLLNLPRFAWFDGGSNTEHVIAELTKDDALCDGMPNQAHRQRIRLEWR
jgi:hypothetical protein